MFDQLVADEDLTTTGGRVFANKGAFFNERGKAYATSGDVATCGNCKGLFALAGTASSWSDEGGGTMVKNYDRVFCPCGKNFVLAAGSSTAFYSDEKDAAPTPTFTTVQKARTYNEQFTLYDAYGRTMPETFYTIYMSSGELIHGVTDSGGRTRRHKTDGARNVRIYFGHRGSV
jgi:hypothetical protein